MKKKFIALLAGALLVAGMSGNAFAAFADGDLIQVVYNAASLEYATDLGSVATLAAATNGTVIAGGTLPSSTAGYNVAYFAFTATANGDASNQLWASNTASTVKSNYTQWSSTTSALDAAISSYLLLTPNANGTVSLTANQNGTYYNEADSGGTGTGKLGGIIKTGYATTEATLAAAATQGIYYFSNTGTSQTGVLDFSVTTNANGTVTLGTSNVAATPIPPAFFLMGSGLLGMFGLRRKKA